MAVRRSTVRVWRVSGIIIAAVMVETLAANRSTVLPAGTAPAPSAVESGLYGR